MNVGNQNTQQVGQNPVSQPVISPDKPKVNYLLIGGIVLACFVVFGFGGYYLGKQTFNSSMESSSTQPYSSPTTTISSPTPENSVQPTNVLDETANWNTFSTQDGKVKFQYPPDWTIEQNTTSEGWGKPITTANFKKGSIRLSVSVANAFMNECMQETSKQAVTISGVKFQERKFKGVYLGGNEACSDQKNINNLEIWLQPTIIEGDPYNYQYGLDMTYNTQNQSEAEKIFSLVLSTLKFIE